MLLVFSETKENTHVKAKSAAMLGVLILTRPFSTSLVVMTITLVFSCHTICQKSLTVVARHPWVAM